MGRYCILKGIYGVNRTWPNLRAFDGRLLRGMRTASDFAGMDSGDLAVGEFLPTHIWCQCLGWPYYQAIRGRFLRITRTASGFAGTNSTVLAVDESLPEHS